MRRVTLIAAAMAMLVSIALPGVAVAESVADRPVLLVDAQAFEENADVSISHTEISEAGRKLVSAVSSEKFMAGASVVVVLYCRVL